MRVGRGRTGLSQGEDGDAHDKGPDVAVARLSDRDGVHHVHLRVAKHGSLDRWAPESSCAHCTAQMFQWTAACRSAVQQRR